MSEPIKFWQFVGLCLEKTWERSWEKADTAATIAGIAIGILLHFVPGWEQAVNRIVWEIPLAALGSLLIVRLFLSPFLVYRKRDKEAIQAESQVAILTQPVITLSNVITPQVNNYPNGETGLLYRIDVFNCGGRSAHNTEVKLIRVEPDIPELRLPVPLQQMHDYSTRRLTEFSLNPQDHKYIDFVGSRSGTKGIMVWHIIPGVLSLLASGNYVLTVCATGESIPSASARFHVWDTDGRLHCEML